MKLAAKVLVICIAYIFLIETFPSVTSASCPGTPLEESSTVIAGSLSNCGETTWDLKVRYGDNDYDEGEYDADGTCTGGWIRCNCTPVLQSFKVPTKNFQSEQIDGTDYSWWWAITNYDGTPILNACSSGNCMSTGYSSEQDPTWVDPNVGYDEQNCQ